MGFANLLVHVQLGQPNTPLLRLCGHLAEVLKAGVTGMGVRQPMRVVYAEGYMPDTLLDQDRADIDQELAAAEAEFRSALGSVAQGAAWRSAVTYEPLADVLAREARCADLVITGVDEERSLFDSSRYVDVGALVMQAGRPCLIVPREVEALGLDHAVIGWKDTVETRRAVVAALPMLTLAKQVTVVTLAPKDEMERAGQVLKDVTGWLGRHGVTAAAAVETLTDDTGQLEQFMAARGADLTVAGAYGHSRVREWALGGVTRNLLLRGSRCALVTH